VPEPLSTYRAKRDPDKTPEPMGATGPGTKSSKPSFVIQEHHARALHWDFRLERDGVLVSWALPKGLPESPSKNHLAVHTEDHPLEYATFHGDIPKGEYGGGNVTVWDHGRYDLEKWSDREVMVVLHGERSSGRYVLFRTGGKNWMIHRMDPAPEGYETLPSAITPTRATQGELPGSDSGWAYEFLWDGIRSLVYIDGGRVRLRGESTTDLTALFPELRPLGEFLGSRPAILDGAVVAFDDNGVPSRSRLEERLIGLRGSKLARAVRQVPVTFLAFDLLYLEGHLLTDRTYDERRRQLDSLRLAHSSFVCPPSVRDGQGNEIFRIARDRGLLGVVAKRRDSRYEQTGRNSEWVKIQAFPTQALVAGGLTRAADGGIESVLLGLPAASGLTYEGTVSGLRETELAALKAASSGHEAGSSPFSKPLPRSLSEKAEFLEPSVVVEVRYSGWPRSGRLKDPQWRGIRPDKDPVALVRARSDPVGAAIRPARPRA
jgi:bifunctional non-homologous end joining protein LigD